jgi:RNA polymerase sigma-70 factor (ECF subfamily)
LRAEAVLDKPDSVLVEEALNGDAASFTELCWRYYPVMVAIAHSILADRDLAEDAAQSAFAKAVHKLPQLRRKKRFGAWLAAICRRTALDLAGTRQLLREARAFTAKGTEVSNSEAIEAVRAAIAALPASYRELVFLRFYDGMSYEKISDVLGISRQAINGRLRRAKRKVADYLRRNGFDEVRL